MLAKCLKLITEYFWLTTQSTKSSSLKTVTNFTMEVGTAHIKASNKTQNPYLL